LTVINGGKARGAFLRVILEDMVGKIKAKLRAVYSRQVLHLDKNGASIKEGWLLHQLTG